MKLPEIIGTSLRGIFAFLTAFVAAIGGAVTADEGFGDIDAKTYLWALSLALAAGGGVWGITNQKPSK